MTRSHVAQIVFILIILYCVSSINVLILAIGIVRTLQTQGAYFKYSALMLFAVTSFVMTVLIIAYHMSTMFRNRKRRYDRVPVNG